ncbi:hypothetical protein LTR56_015052 [Elasticomyces elasticus]|nr:hypothetical protein LTR56_015052 [Elasticomyces elasticus]KAK3639274.1 hypothetical protein LTR22_017475 [Elasticomyces elasticus]KAK4915687.1 hypothetical protein LTR49_016171 [Elasticomyces elasticus]KAK5746274.1 hypothetical protein LTS12_022797 [Elasticomyces elasticus]
MLDKVVEEFIELLEVLDDLHPNPERARFIEMSIWIRVALFDEIFRYCIGGSLLLRLVPFVAIVGIYVIVPYLLLRNAFKWYITPINEAAEKARRVGEERLREPRRRFEAAVEENAGLHACVHELRVERQQLWYQVVVEEVMQTVR